MPSRTALLRLHYFAAFAAIGAYNPFFPTWLRARGIEGLSMSALTALNPLLGIVSPWCSASSRIGSVASPWKLPAAVAAALLATSLVARRIHERPARAPTVWLLAAGVAATAVRLLLLGTVRSLPALLALQPLHALTFALTWISGLELVKARAPESVLATAQSTFAVAAALGSACGMLAWGPLHASRAGFLVFAAAGGVATAACSAVLALVMVQNGALPEADAPPSTK